jgi:hypothetical protein
LNKFGALLEELHNTEIELADRLRVVGERHGADHDIWHMCHLLADQTEARAAQIRDLADRYDAALTSPHHAEPLQAAAAAVRHKTSALLGRRPEGGLLLLRDLRELFLAMQSVNAHWLVLGQVAQALRDTDMLETVTGAHKQVLTQIKWVKTRLKEASPQVFCVPSR